MMIAPQLFQMQRDESIDFRDKEGSSIITRKILDYYLVIAHRRLLEKFCSGNLINIRGEVSYNVFRISHHC